MKRGVVISLVVLAIIILAAASYFIFSSNKIICQDKDCFVSSITTCKAASYLLEDNQTIKAYNIIGKEGANCKINVKLVSVKQGNIGNEALEGSDMDCYIPLDSLVMPDTDLNNCHGLLKEQIQDQVIQRMHRQILENLQQINNTLGK